MEFDGLAAVLNKPVVNIVLLSLPEGLACMLASLILLRERIPRAPVGLAGFALAYPVFWIVSFHYIAAQPNLYFLNQIAQAVFVILLCRLFISNSWNKAVLMAAIFVILVTLVAMASFILELLFTGYSSSYFNLVPVPVIIRFWWPANLLLLGGAYYLSGTPAGRMFGKMDELSSQGPFIIVAVSVILQFSIVTGALTTASAHIKYAGGTVTLEYLTIIISFLLFFISSLAIIVGVVSLAEDIEVQSLEGRLSRQVETIRMNLQTSRHDFIHHVQVLAILFQEGSIAEFRTYLGRVDREMRSSQDGIQDPEAVMNKLAAGPEDMISSAPGQVFADGC